MKKLQIMDLKISRLFDRSKGDLRVDTTYIITYEDLTYQIFDYDDLSESEKQRITHFMKTSELITTATEKYDPKRVKVTAKFFKIIK